MLVFKLLSAKTELFQQTTAVRSPEIYVIRPLTVNNDCSLRDNNARDDNGC